MQFKKLGVDDIAVTAIRSKLHDMENQRAPKFALFERGVDVGLVLLMYDALLMLGSFSTRSKICSSACSILSVLLRPGS